MAKFQDFYSLIGIYTHIYIFKDRIGWDGIKIR